MSKNDTKSYCFIYQNVFDYILRSESLDYEKQTRIKG